MCYRSDSTANPAEMKTLGEMRPNLCLARSPAQLEIYDLYLRMYWGVSALLLLIAGEPTETRAQKYQLTRMQYS